MRGSTSKTAWVILPQWFHEVSCFPVTRLSIHTAWHHAMNTSCTPSTPPHPTNHLSAIHNCPQLSPQPASHTLSFSLTPSLSHTPPSQVSALHTRSYRKLQGVDRGSKLMSLRSKLEPCSTDGGNALTWLSELRTKHVRDVRDVARSRLLWQGSERQEEEVAGSQVMLLITTDCVIWSDRTKVRLWTRRMAHNGIWLVKRTDDDALFNEALVDTQKFNMLNSPRCLIWGK